MWAEVGGPARRVAVMQPYFLPYLGYWQLMRAVDTFVIYDTVQYTKGGWINRNRYLGDGEVRWLTIPVARGSLGMPIGERRLAAGYPAARDVILRRVEAAYREAPFRESGMALLEDCLPTDADSLLELLMVSLRRVAAELGIDTDLRLASQIVHNPSLAPAARVIDLCRATGATAYYNLSGGRLLYSRRDFSHKGLNLWFHRPPEPPRSDADEAADQTLSILDLTMRNDPATNRRLLDAADWEESA